MATKDPLEGTEPSSKVGGRPPALKPEHIAVLRDIVTERAQASLKETAGELSRRSESHMCDATVRRMLRAQGIVRSDLLNQACFGHETFSVFQKSLP
jgi:putative transposase